MSFQNFIVKAGEYSEEEKSLLKEELQLKELSKDELLLRQGEICKSICFIVDGSFCQYRIGHEGLNHIIDLNTTNDWLVNFKSFMRQSPSDHVIKAYEDSSIYELDIEAIHRLIAKSQTFLQMGKILEEVTQRVSFFDNNNSPLEKYKHLLEIKPELIQKFPQKLIASYLKITPETLSRVRRKMIQETEIS